MELEFRGSAERLASETNICDLMGDDDLLTIGRQVQDGYISDKNSRSEWERSNAEVLKLALQVKDAKSFPWQGCSNVKFPLLTIAAMNWHAKAYPATISGDSVVRMKTVGTDSDGVKSRKAERVGKHMSYQLLETTDWEEQTDKLLFVLPILGCAFKKTIRDNNRRINCSDLVLPQDLIVDYFATSTEHAQRVTHLFTMSPNDVHENVMAGIYRKSDAKPTADDGGPLGAARDLVQKTTAPSETLVFNLAEQSCWLDLDNDGYKEPYCVVFDRVSGFVYRILARYYTSSIKRVEVGPNSGKIQRIEAENYFTKFSFVPSPDGGFYDLGFGILLGPLNESVNSALNQIFDGGTMATLGGGFLGRGVKMKAGEASFKPFEWKTVDSTGTSLRDNIVPLTVREPSMILLELIKFLVGYGERVAGASEIEMGQLPDNAKAGAVDTVNENGQKIFNATYKRVWRSLKNEFKKMYKLNQLHTTDDGYMDNNQYVEITAEDYSGDVNSICPVADPNVTSDADNQTRALMVASRAQAVPGYNPYLVETTLLDAYSISNVDALYPDPQGPNAIPPQEPPPDPMLLKVENDARLGKMKLENEARALDLKGMVAESQAQADAMMMMIDGQESEAKAQKLQAEAILILKEADSTEVDQAISLLNAQIGAEKANSDKMFKAAKLIMDGRKNDQRRVGVVDAVRSNS